MTRAEFLEARHVLRTLRRKALAAGQEAVEIRPCPASCGARVIGWGRQGISWIEEWAEAFPGPAFEAAAKTLPEETAEWTLEQRLEAHKAYKALVESPTLPF